MSIIEDISISLSVSEFLKKENKELNEQVSQAILLLLY